MAVMDIAEAAWAARWRGVRPNAAYYHTFGLETAWRAHSDEWGYPLEDTEQRVSYGGKDVPGRTFSKAGMVVWLSTGHKVVGWPQ